MIIDRKNEKLIHAMVFFIKKTKHCYKLKLFKLLYFLDFEHFKQTGRSVTGLEYFAWKIGPVPTSLYDKINNPYDFKEFFTFVPKSFFDSDFTNDKVMRISPKIHFDKSFFSKRELRIMNQLVDLYKNIQSKDMIKISHNKKGPWYKVFKKENKPQQIIPYEYALDHSPQSISIEEVEEIQKEHKEMNNMFAVTKSV